MGTEVAEPLGEGGRKGLVVEASGNVDSSSRKHFPRMHCLNSTWLPGKGGSSLSWEVCKPRKAGKDVEGWVATVRKECKGL